jgi:hypothetical protein
VGAALKSLIFLDFAIFGFIKKPPQNAIFFRIDKDSALLKQFY